MTIWYRPCLATRVPWHIVDNGLSRSPGPTDKARTFGRLPSETFGLEAERVAVSEAFLGQSPLVSWRWRFGDGLEILFGRALAAFVSPFATWRLCSAAWRLWTLTAYFSTGYVIVLGALLVFGAA
jgi:hypothetical protein